MKCFLLITSLLIPAFAGAAPSSLFLTCTSKTYTFVVIPNIESDVNQPYFEGVYAHGALVSYAFTSGKPVHTLNSGQKVWSQNGGFTITVGRATNSRQDKRRPFKIEDADGDGRQFPTEKGLCTGDLEN